MRETAFFDLAQAHLQLPHLGCLFDALEVRDAKFLTALDVGDLFLAQIDHLVRVLDDRGRVRSHEILVLPYADQQRASLAGGDDLVRLTLIHNHQRIGTDDVIERQRHGFVEGNTQGIHHILDQLDHDLRIRLAPEMVPFPGELGFQGLVVFDDAVVDQRKFVVLGIMRMRVHIARLAVRSPTGVGDAHGTGYILAFSRSLQVLDLSLGFVDDQIAIVVHQRHAGAVIPPVFEPGQALDQDRIGLAPSDITYDSTHNE